jgi:hypothetical protein
MGSRGYVERGAVGDGGCDNDKSRVLNSIDTGCRGVSDLNDFRIEILFWPKIDVFSHRAFFFCSIFTPIQRSRT